MIWNHRNYICAFLNTEKRSESNNDPNKFSAALFDTIQLGAEISHQMLLSPAQKNTVGPSNPVTRGQIVLRRWEGNTNTKRGTRRPEEQAEGIRHYHFHNTPRMMKYAISLNYIRCVTTQPIEDVTTMMMMETTMVTIASDLAIKRLRMICIM